jgi:hypothetical protein
MTMVLPGVTFDLQHVRYSKEEVEAKIKSIVAQVVQFPEQISIRNLSESTVVRVDIQDQQLVIWILDPDDKPFAL